MFCFLIYLIHYIKNWSLQNSKKICKADDVDDARYSTLLDYQKCSEDMTPQIIFVGCVLSLSVSSVRCKKFLGLNFEMHQVLHSPLSSSPLTPSIQLYLSINLSRVQRNSIFFGRNCTKKCHLFHKRNEIIIMEFYQEQKILPI